MKAAVFAVVLQFVGCSTPPTAVPLARRPGDGHTTADPAAGEQRHEHLTVVVDAEYKLSHGWGHVYQCEVREVRAGAAPQQTLPVSVYATRDLYGGLLRYPQQTYDSLVIGFRQRPDRQYGPPPGFRDVRGMYWEIVSVARDR